MTSSLLDGFGAVAAYGLVGLGLAGALFAGWTIARLWWWGRQIREGVRLLYSSLATSQPVGTAFGALDIVGATDVRFYAYSLAGLDEEDVERLEGLPPLRASSSVGRYSLLTDILGEQVEPDQLDEAWGRLIRAAGCFEQVPTGFLATSSARRIAATTRSRARDQIELSAGIRAIDATPPTGGDPEGNAGAARELVEQGDGRPRLDVPLEQLAAGIVVGVQRAIVHRPELAGSRSLHKRGSMVRSSVETVSERLWIEELRRVLGPRLEAAGLVLQPTSSARGDTETSDIAYWTIRAESQRSITAGGIVRVVPVHGDLRRRMTAAQQVVRAALEDIDENQVVLVIVVSRQPPPGAIDELLQPLRAYQGHVVVFRPGSEPGPLRTELLRLLFQRDG